MSMDLTGIRNVNEYYANHYFTTKFEESVKERLKIWEDTEGPANEDDSEAHPTRLAELTAKKPQRPWSALRQIAQPYYTASMRFAEISSPERKLAETRDIADRFLAALGYPEAHPTLLPVGEKDVAPVYIEVRKSAGPPQLWVMLAEDGEEDILQRRPLDARSLSGKADAEEDSFKATFSNEELATRVFFQPKEPPRFLMLVGMDRIALLDRDKWGQKRHFQFDLQDIYGRRATGTFQAMTVLLHKDDLCPTESTPFLDAMDQESHKNATSVTGDLKFALRSSVELLGNEVLYDMQTRLGQNLDADPVDGGALTLECLRFMYGMLFVLFMEARPELGYSPMRNPCYASSYSLDNLRDMAASVRLDTQEVGEGFYAAETIFKLYDLIYNGYPEAGGTDGLGTHHGLFKIAALKAHIFDPERTPMLHAAKLRDSVMLRIIHLMSMTRLGKKKADRPRRISYANLGINQMGSVYEALLSLRGFVAQEDLYEVKAEGKKSNELDIGYFVPESELHKYENTERVRDPETKALKKYPKGTFVYRLAGRERQESASYYTPESLTKCLVKYALIELLEGKKADDLLKINICEPAMGSAAFLNEAINQIAEEYLVRKQAELEADGWKVEGPISAVEWASELQKVKMYIASRNVYGVDLNPVAVELAEVSLWLNTIYNGADVPWFGAQLVNGDSLIGARRQCYSRESLVSKKKGERWHDTAPTSVPLDGPDRDPENQSYHFFCGDPGMCDYTDRFVKTEEKKNIAHIKEWRKAFCAPFTEGELESLQRLSKAVDELWEAQVEARRELTEQTRDNPAIYGHRDVGRESRKSTREKDEILFKLYKTEHAKNAGAYARLKFAMDYWCSLWFWPIARAKDLPTREQFLFHMHLILIGTIPDAYVPTGTQYSMWETHLEQASREHTEQFGFQVVDLPQICDKYPALDLARQISAKRRFLHWELEFADVFADHSGFDLVVGNPPWIKLEWKEKDVLGYKDPEFAIHSLTAKQTADLRKLALEDKSTRDAYFEEYEQAAGKKSFLCAVQNYPMLDGAQPNLYKCFLERAWQFAAKAGVSALVHPEGVYSDPGGGALREVLYPKLRKHFQFSNELKLFPVDAHTTFGLNVYGSESEVKFETISNILSPDTIADCYDAPTGGPLPGIRDENGERVTSGHPGRVVHVGERELRLFGQALDGSENWRQARLPSLHGDTIANVLVRFEEQPQTVGDLRNDVFMTNGWDESRAQEKGRLRKEEHWSDGPHDLIYTGPLVGVANPMQKTCRAEWNCNSDFDMVDLTCLPAEYLPRCKYAPCRGDAYEAAVPVTPWGTKVTDCYRLASRRMVSPTGERALIPAVLPPACAHVHTLYTTCFRDINTLAAMAGYEASLPFDFYVRSMQAQDLYPNSIARFPIPKSIYDLNIRLRALLLNCLTTYYAPLWEECWDEAFSQDGWSKEDPRLRLGRFTGLSRSWTWDTPLRTDYERRQALVELDVLSAMALGMTLDELQTIYRIQFPVLQKREASTWYDANGRIAYTDRTDITRLTSSRVDWKKKYQNAPAGTTFSLEIVDDTLPGGPRNRTTEYVGPFDRCDRAKDYETAWEFFSATASKN